MAMITNKYSIILLSIHASMLIRMSWSKRARWASRRRFAVLIILSEKLSHVNAPSWQGELLRMSGRHPNFQWSPLSSIECSIRGFMLASNKLSWASVLFLLGLRFDSFLLWSLLHGTSCSIQFTTNLSHSFLVPKISKHLCSASNIRFYSTGASRGIDLANVSLLSSIPSTDE